MGDIDPHCATEQDTLQLTPLLLLSLLTLAARRTVEPLCAIAVLGDTDTVAGAGGGGGEELPPPPQATRQIKVPAANGFSYDIGIPRCNACHFSSSPWTILSPGRR